MQSSSAYNLSKTRVLFVYSWSTKLSGTVDYVSYIEDGHVNVIDNFTGMIIGYLKSGRTKADGLGESWTNVDYSRKSDDFLNPGSSFTSINVTIDSVGKPVITVS